MNLIVFALLGRILSVSEFGITSYMVLLVTTAVTIIDYGQRVLLIKQLTQETEAFRPQILWSKVISKLPIFLLLFLIFLIYCYTNSFWNIPPVITIIFFISSLLMSIANLIIAVFHAYNKFEFETLSLSASVIIILMGVALTKIYNDYIYFFLFYFISSCMLLGVGLLLLGKLTNSHIKEFFQEIDISSVFKEYKLAFSFAIITILDAVYAAFDTFFVERFCSQEDLGLYQGMMRVILGLATPAIILSTVSLPIISRLTKNNAHAYYSRVLLIFVLFIGLGIIIFFSYFLFNKEIIQLLLGNKFMEIIEWDFHLALYTLSRYVRIVPAVFLAVTGRENIRLLYVSVILVITVLLFEMNMATGNVKYAIKTISYSNFILATGYAIIFLFIITPKIIQTRRAKN